MNLTYRVKDGNKSQNDRHPRPHSGKKENLTESKCELPLNPNIVEKL